MEVEKHYFDKFVKKKNLIDDIDEFHIDLSIRGKTIQHGYNSTEFTYEIEYISPNGIVPDTLYNEVIIRFCSDMIYHIKNGKVLFNKIRGKPVFDKKKPNPPETYSSYKSLEYIAFLLGLMFILIGFMCLVMEIANYIGMPFIIFGILCLLSIFMIRFLDNNSYATKEEYKTKYPELLSKYESELNEFMINYYKVYHVI